MEGIAKAIERAALAGKLQAASDEHRKTAEALGRAAARYRAGVRLALTGMVAGSHMEAPRPVESDEGSFHSTDRNG